MKKMQEKAVMRFYKRGVKYNKKHHIDTKNTDTNNVYKFDLDGRSYKLITDAYNVLLFDYNENIDTLPECRESTRLIDNFVSPRLTGWEYPKDVSKVLSLNKLKEDKKKFKDLFKKIGHEFIDHEYEVGKNGNVLYKYYGDKLLLNIDYLIDGMTALGLKEAPLCCNIDLDGTRVPFFKDLEGNGFCLFIPVIKR